MNKTAACFLSIGTVAAAALIGQRSGPHHPRQAIWVARMKKPAFVPSGAVIGAAWSGLDVLLAYSGARLLAAPASRERRLALLFWSLNATGVAGIPWVFFKRKNLGASALTVACMLGCARAAVASAGKVDRVAAWTAMPLVGWLAFAGLLSEEIWRRNPSVAE